MSQESLFAPPGPARQAFRTVYLDPNWPEQGAGKSKRGADAHYVLSSIADIRRSIEFAECWNMEANAHMYMWITNNYVCEGLGLIKDLGFRPITNLSWHKVRNEEEEDPEEWDHQSGIGQYFRGSHELCFFAVRGNGFNPSVMTERRDIRSAFAAKRAEHSRKPAVIYDRIEARSKGPYLEMYARGTRPGWASWGLVDGMSKPGYLPQNTSEVVSSPP